MRRLRRGQAMVETVLAVLIVTAVFFGLFRLSRLLSGKILLEHAAMRVARARAVGFNDFMCTKAARVSVIPVSGKRLWPAEDGSLSASEELARVRTYLESPDGARARGLLEYEGWGKGKVKTHEVLTSFWENAKGERIGFASNWRREPSKLKITHADGRVETRVLAPLETITLAAE